MTYRALKTYWRSCCLEAPRRRATLLASNHPSFICSCVAWNLLSGFPKVRPTRKGPIPQGQKSAGLASRGSRWQGGESVSRESFIVGVPGHPLSTPFRIAPFLPAPGATPAFPVSPLHLSSSPSTCLLGIFGCLWNTYSLVGPPVSPRISALVLFCL